MRRREAAVLGERRPCRSPPCVGDAPCASLYHVRRKSPRGRRATRTETRRCQNPRQHREPRESTQLVSPRLSEPSSGYHRFYAQRARYLVSLRRLYTIFALYLKPPSPSRPARPPPPSRPAYEPSILWPLVLVTRVPIIDASYVANERFTMLDEDIDSTFFFFLVLVFRRNPKVAATLEYAFF